MLGAGRVIKGDRTAFFEFMIIIYRKEPDGALAARVDSGPEADAKAENYRYVKAR